MKTLTIFYSETSGKEIRCRSDDNIKMDLRKYGIVCTGLYDLL
jgi:hypothetical protein